MRTILIGLDFTFVYLDDILVASKSEEEPLKAGFERLQAAGLAVNRSKCVLGVPSVWYFGQDRGHRGSDEAHDQGGAPTFPWHGQFLPMVSAWNCSSFGSTTHIGDIGGGSKVHPDMVCRPDSNISCKQKDTPACKTAPPS